MDTVDAENLRFISTTQRAALEERRRYEWRTFVTTLTLYVLTVSAVYAGSFRLPQYPHTSCAVFLVALLLWAASSQFLSSIHDANATNKSIAEAAERDIVNSLIDSEVKRVLPPVGATKPYHWALRWQCAIIGLVAIVSAVLIVAVPELESARACTSSAAATKQ